MYVRKQIVHNTHVVADLAARGAVFVDELDEVPDGAVVVYSAHGVAPKVRRQAEAKRLIAIDATCPLVAKVHAEARRFTRAGGHVVLIGLVGHEEVDGTMGEAPEQTVLVDTRQDVSAVDLPADAHLTWLSQTTLAVDEVARTVARLRESHPGLADPPSDDICYASQNQQDAVKSIAADSDLLLVVGSGNSSNSRRLVEVAQAAGAQRAHLIEDASRVHEDWLAGVTTIGLTAGASAPEHLVAEVLAAEAAEVLAGRPVSWDDLPKLVRTRRVIDEALRIYPPVWLGTRLTTRNATLAGHSIPAGSVVLWSPYPIHHSDELYRDPGDFVPDRWSPEHMTDSAKQPRCAYVPFAMGARRCIGDEYGLTEAMVILATLHAQGWRLRPASEDAVTPAPRTLTLHPRALPLRLERDAQS